jgi:hypothetical protein
MAQLGQEVRWVPTSGQVKADHLVVTEADAGRVLGELVYRDGRRRKTSMRTDVLHRDYKPVTGVWPYLTHFEADALSNLLTGYLVSEEGNPGDQGGQAELAALRRVREKLEGGR